MPSDFAHFFLDESLCLRINEALLHFLWQGLVIGLAMWLIDIFGANIRSSLRYRLNFFALVLMLACVPVTFTLLPTRQAASARAESSVSPVVSNADSGADFVAVPPPQSERPIDAGVDGATTGLGTSITATDPAEASVADKTSHSRMSRIAPYATAVYLAGVMIMLLRLLMAVWGGQRLRVAARVIEESQILAIVQRQAGCLGLKVAPIVASCSRISVPVVIGIVKPMILLPPAIATGMSPRQLEVVLSHELAHLRRFDLLINLLQRTIEAVLFFHPAVWYVSRRVSIERENSCDDMVLESGCDRLTYADALLKMAELCLCDSGKHDLASASALAVTGKNPTEFKRRVLRVLGEASRPSLRLTRLGFLLLTLMVLSLTLLPAVMQIRAASTPQAEFTPRGPALELSGPITDAKFVDTVVAQVARLPFATSWQSGNAKQFTRQIIQEHLSPEMPVEERRRILESLNEYVTRFLERHQGESKDNSYCRRPDDVRNLLWRLKRALVRETLDEQSKTKLDAQMAEVGKWVRALRAHPRSKLTSDLVITKLKERQADPMEPLFKYPLPDAEFDKMIESLRERNPTLLFAESYAVVEWFYAAVRSNPESVKLTESAEERVVSYGSSNGEVNLGYESTEVWFGNHNGMDAWSAFIDFSQNVPGLRGFDPPKSAIEQGDDAVRQWVESQVPGNLCHVTFDYQKRRLVGVRGTQLLALDVDSYIAADRLDGDLLKDRIRKRGRGEFLFPKPKSVDQSGHELTYDLFLGVLTKSDDLYVIKIETVSTLSKMLTFRARSHNPPHPNEVKGTDGDEEHDGEAAIREAEVLERK